jgi:hypothetical protein
MKNILIATVAAATLVIASVAAPQQAEARYGRNAAIFGGLAAGALLGAAVANGPYYGYGPGPYAYGPGPYAAYYGPDCYWTRHRVWTDYGWRWRRVRVCD